MKIEKLDGELRKFISLGRKILTLQIDPLPSEHPLKSSVPFRSGPFRSVPFRSRVNGALVAYGRVQPQTALITTDQVPNLYSWVERGTICVNTLPKDAILKCGQCWYRTHYSWIVSPTPYHCATEAILHVSYNCNLSKIRYSYISIYHPSNSQTK